MCIFLMFCIFFNRNRWKTKKNDFSGVGHSIPNKIMFVSTILGQKLYEKIDFLQKNCHFSEEGKNITILAMCKLYSVNNDKTDVI